MFSHMFKKKEDKDKCLSGVTYFRFKSTLTSKQSKLKWSSQTHSSFGRLSVLLNCETPNFFTFSSFSKRKNDLVLFFLLL